MNTLIQTLDGRHYDLGKIGIVTRDFIVASPDIQTQYETIPGRAGVIPIETTYGARSIAGVFYVKADDYEDYSKRRDEVFAIFSGLQPFYITEQRTQGKRWLVRTDGSFDLAQERIYGFFDVSFVAPSPFAESTNLVRRRFNSTKARFRNEGNVVIDPREHAETYIEFKGASNGLQIRNLTSGDVWQYNGATSANDIVRITGSRTERNGTSIFGATNKRLITFAPGNNEIQIVGASAGFELTVSTRFYFL